MLMSMSVCHSRQQMELHSNWVEISGRVWSKLTRVCAVAPGLGSFAPPGSAAGSLAAGSRLFFHHPSIQSWLTPSK